VLHLTRLEIGLFFAGIALLTCTSDGRAQGLPQPWADPLDQPARVDVTVSMGVGAPTHWSDLVVLGSISPLFGVNEQVLVRDLRVKPDTEFGGAVTYWRGRYGFRAHAALSRSTLVVGGQPVDAFESPIATGPPVSVDLDTWSYDVRGVVGLIEYGPRNWVWPYASFGFGGITYDLAHPIRPPLLTFIDAGRTRPVTAEELVVLDRSSREFLLAVNEVAQETVPAFNLAIGTDLRLPLGPGGVGLRVELSDHIAPSPVGLRIGELRRASLLASDTGIRFGPVHQLRATAGFVVYIRR
jgi:hypothetical protein